MKSLTCDAWFEALPLFPYQSRQSLVRAAYLEGIKAEREAIASLLPLKTATLIRARGNT